jgi:tripartite-type tricarboxylate transporter receptor subunit TctC
MPNFRSCASRALSGAAAAIVFAGAPGEGLAQGAAAWPARTVSVIVPFAPGAGTDIDTRVFSQKLGEAFGKTFVVDYKPGGGSTIGGAFVAKAAPDGYTLMSASPSIGIVSLLYKDLPYDPIKDFSFISMMTKRPSFLVAFPKAPFNSIAEYLAYAKANPGKINLGTSGAGGVAHLSLEWLHLSTNTKVTFVHYKGGGPSYAAVMAGQVDAVMAGPGSIIGQVRAGKVKVIGVTSLQRLSIVPNAPTVSEQGLPGFEYGQWVGLCAPAGTPSAIVGKLAAEIARIARDPELNKKYSEDATELIGNTPEQFTEHVRTEAARFRKLVEQTGIKPEV